MTGGMRGWEESKHEQADLVARLKVLKVVPCRHVGKDSNLGSETNPTPVTHSHDTKSAYEAVVIITSAL